jgi:ribonuclease VapC
MLIDTSAIIAIMAAESDASTYATAIENAPSRFVGSHVRLECAINIARILGIELSEAQEVYDKFLKVAKIEVLPITDAVSRIAVDAYARFGKGQHHPAQLNFADCFSYACAVSIAAPILFKGNDFSRTDLKPAII